MRCLYIMFVLWLAAAYSLWWLVALILVTEVRYGIEWQPISTYSLEYTHAAADTGKWVWLYIPQMDAVYAGYYSPHERCFRWAEDDGAGDCQPSMWVGMKAPPVPRKKLKRQFSLKAFNEGMNI